MEIDRETLAKLAAVAFHGDELADIPEKIWVDCYEGVAFVRASWATGLTAHRTNCLEELRDMVALAYQVDAVAVAYWRDLPWDQINQMAQELQGVR
jgi:hypothetical protein